MTTALQTYGTPPNGVGEGVVPMGAWHVRGGETTQPVAEQHRFESSIPYCPPVDPNAPQPCLGVTHAGNPCSSPRQSGFEFCHGHARAVAKVVGQGLVALAGAR